MRQPRIMVLFFSLLLLASCERAGPPAPALHFGLQGGADSAGTHTVTSGDTLWSIATRYDLSMQDIIYLNKLHPPYALDIYDRIMLPPPTTYRVRHEDTLYGISRTFDVSMTEIARLNDLSAPYTITPGDDLRMPSVRPASPEIMNKPSSRRVASATRPAVKKAQKILASRTPPRAGSKFSWPVEGRILSAYGPKEGGLHNDGVNIQAPRGAPVRGAENGVIVYAGNELKGYGNLVLIKHADRWMTAYAHLDRIHVKKGQEIRRGETIGSVGSTGGVDSPQLHFEVRRGTDAINPQQYMI